MRKPDRKLNSTLAEVNGTMLSRRKENSAAKKAFLIFGERNRGGRVQQFNQDAADQKRWTSKTQTAAVAEWLRAWDTLTMFEVTVCGRS